MTSGITINRVSEFIFPTEYSKDFNTSNSAAVPSDAIRVFQPTKSNERNAARPTFSVVINQAGGKSGNRAARLTGGEKKACGARPIQGATGGTVNSMKSA
jgi:hypothetical protein